MLSEFVETFQRFQGQIGKAFGETVNMLTTAMLVSLVVGLLVGLTLFVAGTQGVSRNRWVYFAVSTLVNTVRSIPFILFIIVLIPVSRMVLGTGFGVDSSKIPLSLVGIALFARLVEKDLLDVDHNIYETSYALGANQRQYFTHFLLPEARSGLVLSFTSTTISLLSYSTVMGIIGGGGLGYLAINEGYYNFNYKLMWIIIAMMVVLVQIVQAFGNRLAKELDKR